MVSRQALLFIFLVPVCLLATCRLDEFEDPSFSDDNSIIALVCDTPFADQVRGDASFSYSVNLNGVNRTGFSFIVEGNIADGAGYDSKYFVEMDELFLNLTITRSGGELTGLTLTTDCSADDDCTATEYTADVEASATEFKEEQNPLTGLGIDQTILNIAATFNSSGSDTIELAGTFWELISCE